MRRARLFWLMATLLVALGLAPGLATVMAAVTAPPEDSHIKWLILALILSPYMPLLIVAAALLRPRPTDPATTRALGFAALILGTFFTLAAAAFSGAGTPITLMHGLATTLAVTAAFHASSWPALPAQQRRWLILLMAVPAAAAIWSLAAIPVITLSARSIAAGAPYCITSHFRPQPVTSLWDLRGFSFYTTASGYKDTSQDYFHGLLIVQSPEGRRAYNWSPRRLRFDLIPRPENFGLSITPDCTAQAEP